MVEIYLIGLILSILFGLRGIGVFNDSVKYKLKDILLVLIVSISFSWLGLAIFLFGYGKPNPNHPDVI